MDADAGARGSRVPTVGAGAGGGERGVAATADAAVAVDGDRRVGMDVETQGIHLLATAAVYEGVGVSAAGIVGGAVPGVGAAALISCDNRARRGAATRYGDTSVDTSLATVAPNRPNSVVVVPVDAHVVYVTCRCGVVHKGASIPVDLVVVESGRDVLDGCFDGKAPAVVGIPISAITVNGTFVGSACGSESC